jgi:hypothetical protein
MEPPVRVLPWAAAGGYRCRMGSDIAALERSRDLWGEAFDGAAREGDLAQMDEALRHLRVLSAQIADAVA